MQGTLGTVQLFGGTFAPRNWLFCQGQVLPIAQNTALFSLLGTIYGGDGRSTFGLPDLRGRVVMGQGTGPGLTPNALGQEGGTETVALSAAQLPAHNHAVTTAATLPAQTGNAGQHEPGAARVPASPTVQGMPGLPIYSTQPADTDIEGAELTGMLQLGDAGGGQPHPNHQPYLAVNYIICVAGLYPSRS